MEVVRLEPVGVPRRGSRRGPGRGHDRELRRRAPRAPGPGAGGRARAPRSADEPAVALTFDPHPAAVLAPDRAPLRAHDAVAQKAELLAALGSRRARGPALHRAWPRLAPRGVRRRRARGAPGRARGRGGGGLPLRRGRERRRRRRCAGSAAISGFDVVAVPAVLQAAPRQQHAGPREPARGRRGQAAAALLGPPLLRRRPRGAGRRPRADPRDPHREPGRGERDPAPGGRLRGAGRGCARRARRPGRRGQPRAAADLRRRGSYDSRPTSWTSTATSTASAFASPSWPGCATSRAFSGREALRRPDPGGRTRRPGAFWPSRGNGL